MGTENYLQVYCHWQLLKDLIQWHCSFLCPSVPAVDRSCFSHLHLLTSSRPPVDNYPKLRLRFFVRSKYQMPLHNLKKESLINLISVMCTKLSSAFGRRFSRLNLEHEFAIWTYYSSFFEKVLSVITTFYTRVSIFYKRKHSKIKFVQKGEGDDFWTNILFDCHNKYTISSTYITFSSLNIFKTWTMDSRCELIKDWRRIFATAKESKINNRPIVVALQVVKDVSI